MEFNKNKIKTKIAISKIKEENDIVMEKKKTRNILKTGFPDNKPEPYMYYNCEIREKDKNKPVVFFTRKPGMIVSYEDVGNWVDGIDSSNKDEFIMAIFVLNSDNTLVGDDPNYKLEEYIRKSEMADHNSWGDFSMGNFNPRIVSKVQSQVNSKKNFLLRKKKRQVRLILDLGKCLETYYCHRRILEKGQAMELFL